MSALFPPNHISPQHGSGKTTAVRDATRILSQESNVFVVDTWNEIAGHGNTPHPSIGEARRMMVKSPSSQADAIVRCVRNHDPSIVAIDEIVGSDDAEAARRTGERGIRMIAGARMDLRSLIRNADLRDLVGGAETNAVGTGASVSAELRLKSGSKKVRRAGAPVFDVVVELKSDRRDEWHVVANAAHAVDDVLRGKKYDVQMRRRCPRSGDISVEHGKS